MPRHRPSQDERRALREAQEWTPVPPASQTPLEEFLSFEDDTLPQPGNFSAPLSLNPEDFISENFESGSVFGEFAGEMSAHMGELYPRGSILPDCAFFGGHEFSDLMMSSACAAVCARVYVHEELDLGDIPIDDLEASFPRPMARFIQSRGTSTDPDGVVWRMSHPESFAASAIRTAGYILRGEYPEARDHFWLPTCPDDPRTRSIVAKRLGARLRLDGVPVHPSVIERYVFSGIRAPWCDNPNLSFTAFQCTVAVCQQSTSLFLNACQTGAGMRVLRFLDLTLHHGRLDTVVVDPLVQARELLQRWRVLRPATVSTVPFTYVDVNYASPGCPTQASLIIPHSGGFEVVLARGVIESNLNDLVTFSNHSFFHLSSGHRMVETSSTPSILVERMISSF